MTNEELRRPGTERWIIQKITQRKVPFLGHVIRKKKLEQHVTSGKITQRNNPEEDNRERPRAKSKTGRWLPIIPILSSVQRKEVCRFEDQLGRPPHTLLQLR